MIVQTIHELVNPLDAYAKDLGYCCCLFLTAGSNSSNPEFMVRLYESGDMRVVSMIDLKFYGNPSNSEKLVPEIPKDWEPKKFNFI